MTLLRVDGSMTRQIFSSSAVSEIKNLTNLNGTLYFTGSDSINGNRCSPHRRKLSVLFEATSVKTKVFI